MGGNRNSRGRCSAEGGVTGTTRPLGRAYFSINISSESCSFKSRTTAAQDYASVALRASFTISRESALRLRERSTWVEGYASVPHTSLLTIQGRAVFFCEGSRAVPRSHTLHFSSSRENCCDERWVPGVQRTLPRSRMIDYNQFEEESCSAKDGLTGVAHTTLLIIQGRELFY